MSSSLSFFKSIPLYLDSTIQIPRNERDIELTINKDFLEAEDCSRIITIYDNEQHKMDCESGVQTNGEKREPRGQIEEHILLWPSAPIYSFGWPRVNIISDSTRSPWHTMRLLKRPGAIEIDRVYIFFNGLNECQTLTTYYRLADLLFLNEERRRNRKSKLEQATSACIIHPFPGHLTRHPFSKPFFKQPFERYVEEPSELFRQFLRHMIETQWLLSAIVPFNNIPLKTGLDLLARGKRGSSTEVAESICKAWELMLKSDTEVGRRTAGRSMEVTKLLMDLLVNHISRLRKILGWQLAPDSWYKSKTMEKVFRPLSINAVGYSMGGFVAQATMFTWPQAIATCTMLASGGNLSDVHAAFVHEEEWLYLLDRLIPSLENPAIAGRIPIKRSTRKGKSGWTSDDTPQMIYGMPRGYYSAFRRAFDQIFLQRSIRRREYKDWLEEFHDRLLFILGGRDPVVKVANVISSAPLSGINALEIAGLRHELHDRSHLAWQKFWLPRIVTRTIEHFVRRREKDNYMNLRKYWNYWLNGRSQNVKDVDACSDNTPIGNSWQQKVPEDKYDKERKRAIRKELSLNKFEKELMDSMTDWMKTVRPGHSYIAADYPPFVVIARNRVPSELFPETFLECYGMVNHYSEEQVAQAEKLRLERHNYLKTLGGCLKIILPNNFETIEAMSMGGPLAQWPDATGGGEWSPSGTMSICKGINRIWEHNLLIWNSSRDKDKADTLPDCWFFFSTRWMFSIKAKNGNWDKLSVGIKKGDKQKFQENLDEVRIFKVSSAQLGIHYAGYQVLDDIEKLRALEHLQKVLTML